MSRRVGPAIAAALTALALTGCGGNDEAEVAGPATVAPADSQIYVEAVLRPEGEERTAIETPLAALLGTEEPGATIIEELDRELAEEGSGVTYAEDIEPWLGERGAVFFTDIYGGGADEAEEAAGDAQDCIAEQEPLESDVAEGCALRSGDGFTGDVDGAFAVQVTDAEAALAFAESLTAEEGEDGPAEEASYNGVAYRIGEDGDAYGVVGEFLVAGSEPGFQAAVDAETGGESLAGDEDFDSLLGAEADAAGRFFADVPVIAAAAEEAGEISAEERTAFDSVFAGVADQPLTAVLDAQTTGFGFDVSYGATEVPFLSAAAESALLRELPGDSWLAAGFTGAGDAIGSILESAEDFGVTGEVEDTREQFRREYGLELEDAFEPLGDGALFANGAGIFGTGGGVVFETGDPAGAERLVAGLERAAKRGGEEVRSLSGSDGATGFSISVPGAPGAVNFVAGGDRVVVAYGEAATAAALEPDTADGTLGESEAFTEAESALGTEYEVTGYLDFAPLLELVDLAAATDPSLEQALPYLESLDFLITGSRADGERERQRIFLGIGGITVEPSA